MSGVVAEVDLLSACKKLNDERIYTWPTVRGLQSSTVCVQGGGGFPQTRCNVLYTKTIRPLTIVSWLTQATSTSLQRTSAEHICWYNPKRFQELKQKEVIFIVLVNVGILKPGDI